MPQAIEVAGMRIEVGKSYRLFYNEGNPNNMKLHVRAIVDDRWIVYRYWSYHKRRWRYVIESAYLFELWIQDGQLTEAD